MTIEPEFSHIVQISELGNRPLELDLEANSLQCEALANRFKVSGLEDFKAHVSLKLLKSGDVDVAANFSAKITQPCAVTLKPVETDVKAKFSVTYSVEVEEELEEDEEDFEDFKILTDPPELLVDQKIDVGDVLAEHLALEIDPFPRLKGAKFEGFIAGSKQEKETGFEKKNPFAALSKLQIDPKSKKNKD